MHDVHLLNICVSTVAVRKFAVGMQAVRSRASVRGVAENCPIAGYKTALTAGKQTECRGEHCPPAVNSWQQQSGGSMTSIDPYM